MKDRLERGRALLHGRLVRRGVAPSAALGATLLVPATGSAIVSARVANHTTRSVLGGAVLPPRVVALAQSLFPAKLKMGAMLWTLGLLAGSVGLEIVAGPVSPDEALELAQHESGREARSEPGTDLYGDPLPPGGVWPGSAPCG